MAKSSGGSGRAAGGAASSAAGAAWRQGESINDYVQRRSRETGLSVEEYVRSDEFRLFNNTTGQTLRKQETLRRRRETIERRAAKRRVTVEQREGAYVLAIVGQPHSYLAGGPATLLGLGDLATFPTRSAAEAYARRYHYKVESG